MVDTNLINKEVWDRIEAYLEEVSNLQITKTPTGTENYEITGSVNHKNKTLYSGDLKLIIQALIYVSEESSAAKRYSHA